MCGIFGAFNIDPSRPADLQTLRRMGEVLAHRGPDGGGLHTDGALGIGMRRLSIIDLKTGNQPLANEDGSIWVVFNGEIYNYRELTAELLAKGHRFATASDTEVLVHLYEEYGEAGVERLRGMFAFAIWDHSRRTLFLARDRLGIKPLYYAETPKGFVFASELKAVVQNPWARGHVDRRALAAYLQYGYVPDPLSIVERVAKLPPGHTLTVQDGRAGVPRRYWEVTACFRNAGVPPSEEDASERLWTLLRDAVRSHLVSDVPVGAFLSGGVDSTTVVAIMAAELGAPVKTFSVGFREKGYNELPYARQVAERYATEHHELLVGPQDLGLLDDLLRAVDEPFADASSIPTYLVSRLARQHVKVVLSGDGGDELFAGYDRYVVDYRRRHLGRLGDMGLGGGLRVLSASLPEGTPGKNFLYNLALPRMERYLDSISLFPPRALRGLLDLAVVPDGATPFDTGDSVGLDPLSRLQALDLRTYLPGDILTKVDRASMANSLEARVPLLDHYLVEFACALPAPLRLRSEQTKYLLKRVMRDRIPREILDRPKQGFAVPLEAWFNDRLPGFFHDLLGGASRLTELGIRSSAVRSLMELYARKRRPEHCRRLWALAVLDRALRRLSEVGCT
ncbi:MAG: asparagine synthase (glutamine-hydrolyzing) [Candidatus Rokuibacteriota bacterium]|nr:MAG: asparagine synthase (glutamine-hydrolyzing) [Candidatus Rokubacteria bacterium]